MQEKENKSIEYYLREVSMADDGISDHFMLKTELDIFKGTEKELEEDRKYWIDKVGPEPCGVKYFGLKEIK